MTQPFATNGSSLKFGRSRPVSLGPHFKLHRYLRQSFPQPPPTCDYWPGGDAALRDVMGNDSLGDCVIASGYHVVGNVTGNAGALFHASLGQVIADYSAIAGYVPGHPETDQGSDEIVALNYWCSKGFQNGTKALGWLTVDATNRVEVMTAAYLFEHLIQCIELPGAWVTPFPSGDGFVWDVGTPNPQNGHAIMSTGYDASGLKIDTWGMSGVLTWAALAALCTPSAGGGLYVLLTPDMLAKGAAKAPNGVAWADLVNDFDQLGGSVPVPPSPPPPVSPPAGLVTLAEAQDWTRAALEAGAPLLTRGTAQSTVAAALAAHWRTP